MNKTAHVIAISNTWESHLPRAIFRSPLNIRHSLKRGGVADEWVTLSLRQGNSQMFKKYSQMKLKIKTQALEKLNRQANEMTAQPTQAVPENGGFGTLLAQL